jgi:hypothetical protein
MITAAEFEQHVGASEYVYKPDHVRVSVKQGSATKNQVKHVPDRSDHQESEE